MLQGFCNLLHVFHMEAQMPLKQTQKLYRHELGLFRLGRVEPENRQSASKVSNYPNPYAPSHVGSANITYQIDSPGLVTLAIFNSLGHPVRVLVNEFQEVGVWTAAWDGHDQAGLPVSSGVYLYQLVEGGRRYQSAITVVR